MKKSTRTSKTQNKSKRSNSNKNSNQTPNDDSQSKEAEKDNNVIEEENRPLSPFLNPYTLSRNDSADQSAASSTYNNQNPFNPNQISIHFNFGTQKEFISNNNPNKSFTESIFSLNLNPEVNSFFSNNEDNLSSGNNSTSFNNEDLDDNETPSAVLEIKGQTGEENEERIFDAPAILYRVQMEETANNSILRLPESPFFPTTSPLKKVQFSIQSYANSRPFSPSTPLSSANMSRSSSAGISTEIDSNNNNDNNNNNNNSNNNNNNSLNNSSNTNRSHITGRSNSTPSPKPILAEVGVGDLHLNKGDGFYRLVMRRRQIGKVCLNMRVFSQMKPIPQQRNYVSFIGYEVSDSPQENQEENSNDNDNSNSTTPQLKYEIYKLRFKDEATQKDFVSKLNEIIKELDKK